MPILVYEVVNAGITGALIIPLFVLWICGLCMARRRGDPARTGFRYLHFVMPILVLSLVFNVVASALSISVDVIRDARRFDTSLAIRLAEAEARINYLRRLTDIIASVLSIIMFVELGNGFAFARKGARDGTQKILRFLAIGAAVVMFIIGLSYFGLINSAFSDDLKGVLTTVNRTLVYRNARLLFGSWFVLMWIASVALLVQAAIEVHKSRVFPAIQNSSVLYLVAVIFFFIRCLYNLIYSALYLLARGGIGTSSPLYMFVIDAIFSDMFFFISLVLVVSMGFRKNGGLNSNPGTPMTQANGYAPGQQVIYPQQTMPQHGYYPHQQQPQMQPGWQYPQGQPQQYYAPSQYPAVGQPVTERKPEGPVNGA